jgi:hypothetical protein
MNFQSIDDAPFPVYPRTSLHATRDEALKTFKVRVEELGYHWQHPTLDASIPQTNAERETVFYQLLGAMKDIYVGRDIGSNAFNSRWAAHAPNNYAEEELEIACWDIINFAEKLHRQGSDTLSIRDPHSLHIVKASSHLTFEQRIRVIGTIAREWKARIDGMIKGDKLETTVAAPIEALQSAHTNKSANDDRALKLKFATEHEDGPKRQPRKRTRAATGVGHHDDSGHSDNDPNCVKPLSGSDNVVDYMVTSVTDSDIGSRKRTRITAFSEDLLDEVEILQSSSSCPDNPKVLQSTH